MSKRHNSTLHRVITVSNNMFAHMDGIMQASAKKKSEWQEDLYITLEVASHKLPK